MYCNYLLILIFTYLTLRATARGEACFVRVELAERMINVMNSDELCACLKYEKITTSSPKAVAPCNLNIVNSGENMVFSVDNMCECAGYQSSVTLTDKLDVSETDDNVTEYLDPTTYHSSIVNSGSIITTDTENTVTDAITTTVTFFFKNATVSENDTSKTENITYDSTSTYENITIEAGDLIKNVSILNDPSSTVSISTTDSIEMLSGANNSDTSHIESRTSDVSYTTYDNAKDIIPEHFNTSTEILEGHKDIIETFTTEALNNVSTIAATTSDEVVKNISDTLNVTEKWNIYGVKVDWMNFTSATDLYRFTYGNKSSYNKSDEESRLNIKLLYSTNTTKMVNLSEITESMDNVTKIPSPDFTEDRDLYYSYQISTVASFLENNTVDEHSNGSTTESNDGETHMIEYEKNAPTIKQFTDFNKTAVTTHATISAIDTTQTSDSKYSRHQNHPINKSNHITEKDVSITNMVLIIILSMICTALVVLFIVKMIYGSLRKGSYVLPHASSKHIEMTTKQ